jgi:hypothetical protein
VADKRGLLGFGHYECWKNNLISGDFKFDASIINDLAANRVLCACSSDGRRTLDEA